MSGEIYGRRAKKLKRRLSESGLNGAVLVPGPNMRYYTGVNSLLLERPFMMLVPAEGEVRLIAPALESGPYLDSPLKMEVYPWTDSEGWDGAIRKATGGAEVKGRWGVEGRAPFLFLHRLSRRVSPKFEDAEPILQGLREVKDEAEVRLLRRSSEILSRSFEEFPDLLKEGATELDVAKGATDMIYANGGTKVDDVLVQSGPRAANPHGLPSSRKIGRGESIIIDIGAVYEGYYSDITRTYCIGRSHEVERVYEKILEAETTAIDAAKDGVPVGKVDSAARGVLTRAGMGRYFIHRTGHGLGLEVHEAPYIVEGGREKLGSGMCFTVEPGVYMRGKLGVRIEDDVLVVAKKGMAITDTPKEFGWWG